MSIFIFLICTSALESSPFVLFRFSCPVSLLYHIGFLKIDLKMVNANDSKFTQITLSLPKCSYKQRNLNVYSWYCHRIFVPEHFVNTYMILYYFVFLGSVDIYFSLMFDFLSSLSVQVHWNHPLSCYSVFSFPIRLLYHIWFLKIAL